MKVAIVGCGVMGSGIAQRLSKHHQIFLYDHNIDKAKHLEQEGHGKASVKLEKALEKADVIILAVKPQNLSDIAKELKHLEERHTLISLLAGVSLSSLRKHIPTGRLIRMMPNLALLYGEGLTCLTTEDQMNPKDKEQFAAMCEPLGKVLWLPEAKIDAFTAVAGSGPAFIFAIVEAMIDAGIGLGFDSNTAQNLVYQMIKGSLTLLEKSGKHPGALKWQVTSPGGTTIAGLKRFEEAAVRAGIINTFYAAYERAKNLSLEKS